MATWREMTTAMAEALEVPQILEVRGLRIEAAGDAGNSVVVVDNVSFSLAKGEVMGLIGEAGAGKSVIGLSTLAYARGGCQITGGRILFQGHDLRELGRDARQSLRGAKVAYISQSAADAFNPVHTLYDQVCEVALRNGVMTFAQARTDAIRLFRELDLPNPELFGNRYPHQVSEGQLRRAMAAMAMIAKPDLLVLDEPTGTLDITAQVEVLASIKKLIREHGAAALYIGRDPAVVAQIANRILVLRQGKVVEHGSAAQILLQPQSDYTRALRARRGVANGEAAIAPDEGIAPILQVRNVVAGYRGEPPAVDDVTIDLMRNDMLAVVGESGSGKSALARVIAGLLPYQSGELQFDGASLPRRFEDRSRDQRRRIQMIHRRPDLALNPRQTMLDIIGRPVALYFSRSRAEIRARVEELMREVDLPLDYIARRPGALSDAEKQRVCIARALAAEPDVIICDEATATLDPLAAEEILHLLRHARDHSGIACAFMTHDPGIVRRVTNKVAVMLRGQLVAYGPTQEVFSPPYHQHTELLLSSVPEIRPDWLDEVLRRRRKVAR